MWIIPTFSDEEICDWRTQLAHRECVDHALLLGHVELVILFLRVELHALPGLGDMLHCGHEVVVALELLAGPWGVGEHVELVPDVFILV